MLNRFKLRPNSGHHPRLAILGTDCGPLKVMAPGALGDPSFHCPQLFLPRLSASPSKAKLLARGFVCPSLVSRNASLRDLTKLLWCSLVFQRDSVVARVSLLPSTMRGEWPPRWVAKGPRGNVLGGMSCLRVTPTCPGGLGLCPAHQGLACPSTSASVWGAIRRPSGPPWLLEDTPWSLEGHCLLRFLGPPVTSVGGR